MTKLEKIAMRRSAATYFVKTASRRGLWDNIHAKRKRGEAPAKPGDEDYPDRRSWRKTVASSREKTASLLEKVAKCGPKCGCGCPHSKARAKDEKKQKKARRWLKTKLDDESLQDIDGKSSRGLEGKGGGFGERDGGNSGGITYTGQGGGYRPPHTGGS